MSDLFGGSGLGGLLGGLFGGAAGAADASAANANAGHENMTTTVSPWGAASPYLQGLMQMAYGSLGQGSAAWGQLNPQGQGQAAYGGASGPGAPGGTQSAPGGSGVGPGAGGGGLGNIMPFGSGSNTFGATGGNYAFGGKTAESTAAPYPPLGGAAPAGGGGGGSGGDGAGGGGFNGTSPQSQAAIDALLGIAQQGGGPLQGEETNFAGSYLSGQDPNAMGQGTYAAAQAAAQGNPQLQAFLNQLYGGQMPGSPGASGVPAGYGQATPTLGQGGFGGFSAGTSMGPSADAPPPIANENDFISNILAQGQQSYQANPALQQMEDAATAGIKQQMATQTIPGITSASVGSGLMGGSAWQDAMAKAANQETTAVGNAVAPLAYQGYSDQMARQMQAAGLGAQLNENQTTANASMNNAAMAARASAGGAAIGANLNYQLGMAQLAQQGQLARMGAIQSGLGMQQQNQQYDLGQMTNLSDAYGSNQLGAAQLGTAVENIPASQMASAAAAAQAGVGGQNAYQASQNQLRAAMAQVSAENQRTNLSQQEFYDPLTRLGDVSNIIGGLSGRYGSTNVQGTNFTNMPQQNVAGQGLAGLLGGMNTGNQLGNMLGGLGGGGGPMGGSSNAGFSQQQPGDPNAGYGTVLADPSSPTGYVDQYGNPYYGGDPSGGGGYNFDPTGGT